VTIKNHGVDFNRWEERSGVRCCIQGGFFSFFFFLFLFKSCIRLFKGTKNSHAAVSYGVNKTYNKTTNKRKSYLPSSSKA